jgi:6-phosphogluconolactonase
MNMIRVFNDYQALSQGAAEVFVELAGRAITSNGYFNVVLSGGRTPRRMYEILAAEPFREKVRLPAHKLVAETVEPA